MTSYNRTEVVVRLVEIADHATGDDVGCFFTHPGDRIYLTPVCLWFGVPDGETTKASVGPNGLRRDEFSVPCYITAFGFTDSVEAARAAEATLSAFDSLLRKIPRLRDEGDVLIDAGDPDGYGPNTAVTIGPVLGPNPLVREPDDMAVAGFGFQVDLMCSVAFTPAT